MHRRQNKIVSPLAWIGLLIPIAVLAYSGEVLMGQGWRILLHLVVLAAVSLCCANLFARRGVPPADSHGRSGIVGVLGGGLVGLAGSVFVTQVLEGNSALTGLIPATVLVALGTTMIARSR